MNETVRHSVWLLVRGYVVMIRDGSAVWREQAPSPGIREDDRGGGILQT